MQKISFIFSLLLAFTLEIKSMESDDKELSELHRHELLSANFISLQISSFIPLGDSPRSKKQKIDGSITPQNEYLQSEATFVKSTTPTLYLPTFISLNEQGHRIIQTITQNPQKPIDGNTTPVSSYSQLGQISPRTTTPSLYNIQRDVTSPRAMATRVAATSTITALTIFARAYHHDYPGTGYIPY